MRGSPCEKHQPPCTSHLLHTQIPTTHTHIPQYSSPALAHTPKYNAQLRLVMSLSPLGLENSTQRHKYMHTTTFTQTHRPSIHRHTWIKDHKPVFTHMPRGFPHLQVQILQFSPICIYIYPPLSSFPHTLVILTQVDDTFSLKSLLRSN